MGTLSDPFWCLCQKLSLSPLYFNKTLLHKSSERSSLVSGPGLNSSPPGAKNPGVFAWFNNNLSISWPQHLLAGLLLASYSSFLDSTFPFCQALSWKGYIKNNRYLSLISNKNKYSKHLRSPKKIRKLIWIRCEDLMQWYKDLEPVPGIVTLKKL